VGEYSYEVALFFIYMAEHNKEKNEATLDNKRRREKKKAMAEEHFFDFPV
jgi:hypothetical protein